MTEEAFKRWAEKMEGEYEKKKADKNGSFEQWFNKLKESNKNIGEDFSKLGLDPKNFIALKIAEAFYPEWIENGELKPGSIFNNDDNYGSAIKRAFENGLSVSRLDRYISDTKKRRSKNGKTQDTWYWVEICSVLQKSYNYCIFNSIKDINVFLTRVARKTNKSASKDLKDYGLYVRDLNDLCIAYAILHGYSFKETRALMINCKNIVSESQEVVRNNVANTTLTQELLDVFDQNSEQLKNMSKDKFLEKVRSRAADFLPHKSEKHWSTYKKAITIAINTPHEEKAFNIRMSDLNDDFLDEELPGIENIIDEQELTCKPKKNKDSLRATILAELLLKDAPAHNVKKNEKNKTDINNMSDREKEELAIKQGRPGQQDSKFKEDIPWVRKYCIISKMREMYNTNSANSVQRCIQTINVFLEKCYLRTIAYDPIDNSTTDLFDWFVIECLKFDSKTRDAIEGEGISGYKPFCNFLGIEPIDEEYE